MVRFVKWVGSCFCFGFVVAFLWDLLASGMTFCHAHYDSYRISDEKKNSREVQVRAIPIRKATDMINQRTGATSESVVLGMK